jgi:hypothetical protein
MIDGSQVHIFITAQENICKSSDTVQDDLHRFTDNEMVTSRS